MRSPWCQPEVAGAPTDVGVRAVISHGRSLLRIMAAGLLALVECRATPDEVAPRFRDVSREAGITFVHENGASGRKYFVETMGAGGAFVAGAGCCTTVGGCW